MSFVVETPGHSDRALSRELGFSVRHLGQGIYIVDESKKPVPPEVVIEGRLHERFLDYILLPTPTEQLSESQIAIVNAARHGLLNQHKTLTNANASVKRVFELYIQELSPSLAIDWGCGFEALSPQLPVSRLVLTDIDPAVISYQRATGNECFYVSELETAIRGGTVDLIVAIFVFHFNITNDQIDLMHDLLCSGGTIMANVYRRTISSRTELMANFKARGFAVTPHQDPMALCRSHEYWEMTRD